MATYKTKSTHSNNEMLHKSIEQVADTVKLLQTEQFAIKQICRIVRIVQRM